MAETTTLCVSVQAGEHMLSGPDWLKVEDTKTLVDVLVEVSGTQALGYQVQVIVSKEPSFTEAALMQILNSVSMLRSSGSIYVKFLLKSSVLPSQQRYEESKCKAERDTDVPLIESLLSPVKEDKHDQHHSNALGFDSPFESNYLNKLLSDQKLSPTTLSSLKREIIKKRHFTDHENYTTWQEQVVTSPVKDSQRAPVACQEPEHYNLTNWANGHKAESSRGNGENSDVNSLAYDGNTMDDKQWNKIHQIEQLVKLEEQNARHGTVDNSTEDSSALDRNDINTRNTVKKDEVKKAPIRKIIIPKTNRSTALRVKKNSLNSAGMQRKDRNESHKSGMPVLSQKTTKTAQSKPNRASKSKSGSLAVQEKQAKYPSGSVRKAISGKTANQKKALDQNLSSHSKKSNCKTAPLVSAQREESSNESQHEERDDSKHCKTREGFYGPLSQQINDISTSLKSSNREQDLVAEEITQKNDAMNQLNKDEGLERGDEIALLNEGENEEHDITISLNQIDSRLAVVKMDDETQSEMYIRSKQRRIGKSSDSEEPTVESGKPIFRNTTADVPQVMSVNEYRLVSSKREPIPAHNSSIFEFDNLDGKFAKNNDTIDSIDEITIYESRNENRKECSTDESYLSRTLLPTSERNRESTLNDTETKACQNQEKQESQHLGLHHSAEYPGNDGILLNVEAKDNCQISQPLEPSGHCVNSDKQQLSERPRFFKSFSNQSSFGKLLISSFDSSDFVESSEMLRKSSVNGSTSLKRSESLDRYPSGAVPKKMGFFHELKEKTRDADSSSFFSIKENDIQQANLSLPFDNKSSSSPPALSQECRNLLSEGAQCLTSESKSPSDCRLSRLNITLDKINIDDLLISTNESSRLKSAEMESPTFISDIGRESALSRTFSLENSTDNGAMELSGETKDEVLFGNSDKSKLVSNHEKRCEISSREEEIKKPEIVQLPKDDMSTRYNIDFGEEIECHSRRKWNLESDIIDQLLASSLEDQCRSLRETAQRILERIRSGTHQGETHLPSFAEVKQNSSDAVKDKLGITGRVFKALQDLEKQLSEIENNLGK